MIIDIHTHTAETRDPRITRANGTAYPPPERLIAMMDEVGIDKAAIMCIVNPEYRYTLVPPEETIRIAASYPDRLIPFCNFDPRYLTNDTSANYLPILEVYKEMGYRGVGEYIPNLAFDDPLNMNFFAQVQEIGLPLTFHMAQRYGSIYGLYDDLGLPRLEKVLKSFPNLVLLGHSQPFWAEISADVTDDTRGSYPTGPVTPGRLVELLRTYPNLHGDLSAGSGFNAISRDPAFGYRFMEEFKDKLCWGTDIANDPQELKIVPYFRKLKAERLISEEAYESITWRNANRVLGLGL